MVIISKNHVTFKGFIKIKTKKYKVTFKDLQDQTLQFDCSYNDFIVLFINMKITLYDLE